MATIIRIIILSTILLSTNALSERIKDIASILGVRSNQLIGYGLVVGLDGTGDSSQNFTEQSFSTMLNRLGIAIPPGTRISSKNVAAVVVTAELPPFVKPGHRIDVTISSIGSAKSLRGGALLMTPLKGINGEVYAVAQGNLILSGLGGSGKDGSKTVKNVPSVGRIPNGASVEKEVKNPFYTEDYVTFNLHQPDFTTAKCLAQTINRIMGPGLAEPLDPASVKVYAPKKPAKRVSYISAVENLNIESGLSAAKVIVNARSGTVVIGQHVQVNAAAISHGSLTVTITENPTISQPNALAEGETAQVENSNIKIKEEGKAAFVFEPGTSLESIVKAINAVGAKPSDLVAILESLKRIGALKAELVVI